MKFFIVHYHGSVLRVIFSLCPPLQFRRRREASANSLLAIERDETSLKSFKHSRVNLELILSARARAKFHWSRSKHARDEN
jgi:hypothetical protein